RLRPCASLNAESSKTSSKGRQASTEAHERVVASCCRTAIQRDRGSRACRAKVDVAGSRPVSTDFGSSPLLPSSVSGGRRAGSPGTRGRLLLTCCRDETGLNDTRGFGKVTETTQTARVSDLAGAMACSDLSSDPRRRIRDPSHLDLFTKIRHRQVEAVAERNRV